MDWDAEANELGIRDPFRISQNIFHDRLRREENGPFGLPCYVLREPTIEELMAEPSDEEKQNWNKLRNEYVIKRCYDEIGWDCAVYAADHREMKDYLKNLRPCESADGQCRFDCKEFGICEKADL